MLPLDSPIHEAPSQYLKISEGKSLKFKLLDQDDTIREITIEIVWDFSHLCVCLE